MISRMMRGRSCDDLNNHDFDLRKYAENSMSVAILITSQKKKKSINSPSENENMTSEPASFKTLYELVSQGFKRICSDSALSAGENPGSDANPLTPLLRGQFLEEAGRFRVWAKNVGAHREGKASLNHRLREASHVCSMVVELLEDIQRFLNKGMH